MLGPEQLLGSKTLWELQYWSGNKEQYTKIGAKIIKPLSSSLFVQQVHTEVGIIVTYTCIQVDAIENK